MMKEYAKNYSCTGDAGIQLQLKLHGDNEQGFTNV
jgi:hypothetical protein